MLRTFTTAAASNILPLPPPNLTVALSSPFTRTSLTAIRAALTKSSSEYPLTAANPREKHAAILIPLCNVNNTPSILLELRGKLRIHSGEISFPGGRVDTTDKTFLAAALRETHEEVGIVPDRVEILGQVGPPQLSLGGLRVWPYVGFIHAGPQWRLREANGDPEASLPSLQMESLVLSQAEVATAFHLPLAAAVSPARLRLDYFRGEEPYWAIDVSGLTSPTELSALDGEEQGECLHVWGLTGWYLFSFMKALKIYQ